MSMAKKGGIGCGLLLLLGMISSAIGGKAVSTATSGSDGAATSAATAPAEAAPPTLAETPADSSINRAELARIFALGGTSTDLQRDAKEKEIEGKIIDWTGVKVYEVTKSGKCYRVSSLPDDSTPAVAARACPPDGITDAAALNLTTGSIIRVKGKIDDVTMRIIEIEPAIVTP
jgi:hypothetical protein